MAYSFVGLHLDFRLSSFTVCDARVQALIRDHKTSRMDA